MFTEQKVQYFAHGSAVALGGEITRVQFDPSGDHEAADIAMEGASCALAPSGGKAISERLNLSTRFRGVEIVHVASAYAGASFELKDGIPTTTTTAALGKAQFGLPGKRFAIELASIQMVAQRPLDLDSESTFRLIQPVISIDGLEIDFDVKNLPTSYAAARSFAKKGHCVSRAYGSAEGNKDPNPPVVLGLAKVTIKTPGNQRYKRLADNAVYVDGVGQFHFGELIVREHQRTFSLVRFELGCPVDGKGTAGGVGSNGEGQTSP